MMESVVYSGLGKRFIAFFFDYFIVSLTGSLLYFVTRASMMPSLGEESLFHFIYATAFFYFILLESSFLQGTLGKLIVKIKVVNANGENISLLNSMARFFGKFLSALIFGIGFFMVPFTKNKQALHDKLAKTYVVKIENYDELIEGGAQKISFTLLKYTGYALFSLLILFILTSILDSVFSSQFVKDLGEFMALVLGGIIWASIFYGIYRIFKASGVDGEYLASKMLANRMADFRKQDFKVKQKGDLISSSHRTRESAINMTKSAKNDCYIYYKNTLLGVWNNGKCISDQ